MVTVSPPPPLSCILEHGCNGSENAYRRPASPQSTKGALSAGMRTAVGLRPRTAGGGLPREGGSPIFDSEGTRSNQQRHCVAVSSWATSARISAMCAWPLQARIKADFVASLSTQTTAGRPARWERKRANEAITAKSSIWQMGLEDNSSRYYMTRGSTTAMK